jgi:uncharacterized protein (TIGR04255 family)
MTNLPLKLKHDIILEALFELRFEPEPPNEAVFGIIYPMAIKKFQGLKSVSLPISQLPDAVRDSDSRFRYQPLNRLHQEGFSINIGPRVISFSVLKPYIGWSNWNPSILEILHKLSDAGVIKNVERTGLRYLNFIEGDVFPLINVEVKMINSMVKPTTTFARMEIPEGEYTKSLQLANNASINENERGQMKSGSMIDIDIARNKKIKNYDFKTNLETILDRSHTMAKQLFFDILKEDFLKLLEPVYGEITNG